MNPPDTAPRDGTMILASIGWPWLVPAIWNSHDKEWVCACHQMQPMDGDDDDWWFENEREKDKDLNGWLPIPGIGGEM